MMVAESYRRTAYGDEDIAAAATASGFDSIAVCIGHYTSGGLTLAQVADELGLDRQRFAAYHAVWIEKYAEPLNIWKESGDGSEDK